MKTQLCTAFLIFTLPGLSVSAEGLSPMEKLKLGMAAKQQGVPSLIFDRALANHESLSRKNQTTSNCFMAADLTPAQPKAWRICANPVKVEKLPMQVGKGEGAGCAHHIYKNESCLRFFGNRKNYCLPAGGNYITQDVYSGRPNQSSFVTLKGLDAGLNDSAARGVGLQQVSKDGHLEWDRKSQSIFALPARKDGVILEDMAAKRTGGGMSMYIYPAREDIKRFRELGSANYWSQDCESKIGKPGWLGDKKDSDTPSPSEVTAPVNVKAHSQVEGGGR